MKPIDSTKTLSWDQIERAANTYPEHGWLAKMLIKNYLGYVPDRETCVPQLPFIQTLIEKYKQGQISYDTHYKELEYHIRLIRNADFKNTWWITKNPFDEYDYNIYNTELLQNKDRARAELALHLNYEPELEYSLHSEMMLRRLMQADVGDMSSEYIETLFLAMSAVLYRKIFLTEGQEVADELYLLGQVLCQQTNLCPITGERLEKTDDSINN